MKEINKMLEKHEGLKLHPYKCTAGKLTIGFGRNLEDKGISLQEARAMLDNDIAYFELKLSEKEWFKKADRVRKDVLIDMAYNLGFKGLISFHNMIGALSSKDYHRAAREMLDSKWAKQVKGRAITLAEMMRTGEYQ